VPDSSGASESEEEGVEPAVEGASHEGDEGRRGMKTKPRMTLAADGLVGGDGARRAEVRERAGLGIWIGSGAGRFVPGSSEVWGAGDPTRSGV